MTTIKLTLVSLAAASAVFALACSGAPTSDATVDVAADQVDPSCIKGFIGCKPPTTVGGSSGLVGGGSSSGVLDPGTGSSSGGGSTSGGLTSSSGFSSGGVFEVVEPEKGPDIPCYGDGPEGDGAQYRPLPSGNGLFQCWSSRPLELEQGVPWGFDLLSLYLCPKEYPANRCNGFGECSCWTY